MSGGCWEHPGLESTTVLLLGNTEGGVKVNPSHVGPEMGVGNESLLIVNLRQAQLTLPQLHLPSTNEFQMGFTSKRLLKMYCKSKAQIAMVLRTQLGHIQIY